MRLHLLGTTGYHPCERRHTACLMLPEIGLVFDAGTAFFRVGELLASDTLDIYLSHVHLDHCVGITYLFDVLTNRKMQRVTVHGEVEKLAAVREHLFSELLFPVQPPCDFAPLPAGETELDCGARLSHFPLKHPGGSVGYRLDWEDRSLAYVTDTTAAADADYIDHIRDVSVLVHECYFGDDMPQQAELTGHSCLSDVCHVAKAANAGMLLLVHINPLADEDQPLDMQTAHKIFPDCLVAEDGTVVDF